MVQRSDAGVGAGSLNAGIAGECSAAMSDGPSREGGGVFGFEGHRGPGDARIEILLGQGRGRGVNRVVVPSLVFGERLVGRVVGVVVLGID